MYLCGIVNNAKINKMTQESIRIMEYVRGLPDALGLNVGEALQVLLRQRVVFWSWGVSKKVNFANKALALKVNGKYLKGWVVITLSSLDLYDISFLSTGAKKVLLFVEGIYLDQLTDIIDEYIESNPEILKTNSLTFAQEVRVVEILTEIIK